VSVSTTKRHKETSLANKVEVLTSEFAQIKVLNTKLATEGGTITDVGKSQEGITHY